MNLENKMKTMTSEKETIGMKNRKKNTKNKPDNSTGRYK